MKTKVELRYQKVADAKRFFEILSNPHFKYFHACPKTIEAEIEFLKKNTQRRKNNDEHNYSIIYNNELVGGCGIKINQHRKYVGEIGYFLDEQYWNKGITTKAVRLLEKIGFEKLQLKRIEILMDPRNTGSEKVALKCGYTKEGVMKKVLKDNNKFYDACLYTKVR